MTAFGWCPVCHRMTWQDASETSSTHARCVRCGSNVIPSQPKPVETQGGWAMEPREAFHDTANEVEAGPKPWRWSRLRSCGIGVQIWPIEWSWNYHRDDDWWGGQIALGLGPLVLTFIYNDGSMLLRRSVEYKGGGS